MNLQSRFRRCAAPLLAILAGMLAVVHSAAYQVRLFPAAEVHDADTKILHERLGLTGREFKVEDFEDAELEDWLQTNLKGGGGEGTDRTAWAGRLSSAAADSAQFEIHLPAVRLFGIGLADNDGGGERISINGGAPIELNHLPKHHIDSSMRAYFVLVEAGPEEPAITSVQFDQGFSIHFDHLIVRAGEEENAEPKALPRLILELVDGSRLIGDFSAATIAISTRGLKLDLPIERISSLQFRHEENAATLLLKNGEKLLAEVALESVRLSTILGDLAIPRQKIREIKFRFRGPAKADDGTAVPPRSEFHSDEPAFKAKLLRAWLQESAPKSRAMMARPPDPLMLNPEAESPEQQEAKAAIRRIGPAALPFLMEMLRKGTQHSRIAVQGFAALGELAKPAFPDLMQLIDESDQTIRDSAILAVGHLGPAGKEAIPVLIEECRAGNLAAVESLGNIGPASAVAVSAIVARFKASPPGMDVPLIVALGKIGSPAGVPILLEILEQDSARTQNRRDYAISQRRQRAIEALARMGPQAEQAVPALIEQLEKESSGSVAELYFKRAIIQTFGAIGPAAKDAVPLLQEIARNERFKMYRLNRMASDALSKIGP